MASSSGERTRPRDWAPASRCFGIAVVAALVSLFFFCPSFMFWQGLATSHLWNSPEVGRAKATFEQIDNPWAPISSPAHQVIAWRLLFPVTWHYLSLPRGLLLAMPYVGCVLALWLAGWLIQQRLKDWAYTAMAVVLFATLPWFFVSTGWLTYFDSWLVLGLLTVAFAPSRWALGCACLLAPWIDERMIFALPACLAVRAVALGAVEQGRRKEFLRDLVVVAITSFPYPAIRAVAWLHGDSLVKDYVAEHWEHAIEVPWMRYAEGLWSGYRAGWIMIFAAIWFCGRRIGWRWGAAFTVIILGTAVGSLFIATDMSRSLMMICPALLLGIWLWRDAQPSSFCWALPAVLIANLVLPAAHVMWNMQVPILYLHSELKNFEHPTPLFDPINYAERGKADLESGNLTEAQALLDTALELDKACGPARLLRAVLALSKGDLDAAQRDADVLLALDPHSPDGLYVSGIICQRRGDATGALGNVRRALDSAPAEWPRRGEAQQLLNTLSAP